MIVCNGAPKTGTHLLLKTVYLFGGLGYTAKHEHKPFVESFNCKHIHIRRNPRNVLISYIRHFDNADLSKRNIIKHMPIVIEEMKPYIPWIKDKNTLNVTFEDLLTDEKELSRIADYLGFDLAYDHFKKIWGNTSTFTGNLSNWRDWWDEEIDKEWDKNGGRALEAMLGYKQEKNKKKGRKP